MLSPDADIAGGLIPGPRTLHLRSQSGANDLSAMANPLIYLDEIP